jgi:hypothetical protein
MSPRTQAMPPGVVNLIRAIGHAPRGRVAVPGGAAVPQKTAVGKALPDHDPGALAGWDHQWRAEIHAVKEDLEVVADRILHRGCRGVNPGLYLGGSQRFAARQPILIAEERDFEGLRFRRGSRRNCGSRTSGDR